MLSVEGGGLNSTPVTLIKIDLSVIYRFVHLQIPYISQYIAAVYIFFLKKLYLYY